MSLHLSLIDTDIHPRRWSVSLLTVPLVLPLIVGGIAMLLLVAEVWLFTNSYPQIRLHPDSKQARYLMDGFHAVEEDGRGAYRWTKGQSTLRFRQFGRGDTLIFGFALGPAPPTGAPQHMRITYNTGHAQATRQPMVLALDTQGRPRSYRWLVPPDALASHSLSEYLAGNLSGDLTVSIQSDTTVVAPDTRQVGLRLEGVSLAFLGAGVASPPLASMIVQVLFLATWALLLHRLHTPPLMTIAVILGIALLLLLLFHLHVLLMHVYLVRLLLAGVLLCLTATLLPLAERYARWIAPVPLMRMLWGITMLACMIRLVFFFFLGDKEFKPHRHNPTEGQGWLVVQILD